MKHYNFGSIEQFRNICKQIKMEAEYQGKDADAIATFIQRELSNSAICLEDIQSYIKTIHLIEGDAK